MNASADASRSHRRRQRRRRRSRRRPASRRTRRWRRPATSTASRRSCCRAIGSRGPSPTRCSPSTRTSTSSRRRPSATSIGCASAWTDDPGLATAFSPDGFTALHFAAFFGKAEVAHILLEAGADVDVYTQNAFANQPLHSGGGRAPPRGLSDPAGRRRRRERDPAGSATRRSTRRRSTATSSSSSCSSRPAPIRSIRRTTVETPAETAEAAGHPDLAARIREVADARE